MFREAKRFILGKPLSNYHADQHAKIPKWKALSTLSSDALSSVAYATDAILFTLTAVSAAAVGWSVPIAGAICVLLFIITVSYRQTIEAYPQGGGAYTVAKENLGQTAGLVAGASLLIDYTLTVSVSIAAGVENITSAFPDYLPYKLAMCTAVLIVIMLMNLRGISDSATVFAFPTYLFIFSVFVLLGKAAWDIANGNAVQAQPVLTEANVAVPLVLLLRAFGSGCSALTGVEAISNGIPVFREPQQKNAKITLLWMSVILGIMFMGITLVAHTLHIVPHEDETLISLLGRAVFKDSFMYYFLQTSTALILFLAANTSYADFPRLASLLAKDRFVPRQLGSLGDRLVFSNGILGLSIAAWVLVYLFKAESIHLIPLYAVGVFLSFTLSQSGMVVHHLKLREKGWVRSMILNGTGAIATFVVLADICFTKFLYGAWMVVLAIPSLVYIFLRIHRHYVYVADRLNLEGKSPQPLKRMQSTVVIPVSTIHQGVIEAVEYALSISTNIKACYVELDSEATARMQKQWAEWVPGVELIVLDSPYRSIVEPIVTFVEDLEKQNPDKLVTILIPEFVTQKWWHALLHNHTAIFIRAALNMNRKKVITSMRYHL
jgi:amino acid transporter